MADTPSTNRGKQKQQQKLIEKWKGRFSLAQANQQPLFNAASRWFDWFYASKDQSNVAPWRSKVSDPKIASKALGVIMKLAQYDPHPDFKPNDAHDFIKARNNENLIEWQLRNPLFTEPMSFKNYSVLVDAAVAGTGYAMIPWCHREVEYKLRNKGKDGKVVLDEDRVRKVKIGYNEFNPISFFRVFIEPGAQSFYSARYIMVVDYKTTEELEDLNTEYGEKRYINLDKLKGGANEDSANIASFERSRNRLLAPNDRANDKTSKDNEILYCFDLTTGTKLTLANRDVIIQEEEQNDYWHKKPPIAPIYIRPRAHSPFGDGLFERVEKLGAANDAIINHYLDGLDLALNGMILRKEGAEVDMNIEPGGEVVYSGEKPDRWSFTPPDPSGFQIGRSVLNEAIEENTISNYELGISRSNADKTQGTKGGILAIQEAAGDVISFFEKYYAESFRMVFQQWLSNNQQYLDHKLAIRILGPDGWYPKDISPEDIVTEGTLDVDVDVDKMRPKNKDTDRALKLAWVDKQIQLAQTAAKLGQPLNINWYELSRVLAETAGQVDFDRIMEPVSESNDSPTTENRLMLQGKELTPEPNEDHQTHIQIHKELLEDTGVDHELIEDVIKPHIALHQTMLEQQKQQQEQQRQALLQQQETKTEQDIQQLQPMANQSAMLARQIPSQPSPTGGVNVPTVPPEPTQAPQPAPAPQA